MKEFGLACSARFVNVETLKDDTALVAPCERSNPYIFSEGRVWVQRGDNGKAVPLRRTPEDFAELKWAIKERFGLQCDEDDVIIHNLPEGSDDSSLVAPCAEQSVHLL